MESNPSDLFQQTVRNRRREALERIQPTDPAEGAYAFEARAASAGSARLEALGIVVRVIAERCDVVAAASCRAHTRFCDPSSYVWGEASLTHGRTDQYDHSRERGLLGTFEDGLERRGIGSSHCWAPRGSGSDVGYATLKSMNGTNQRSSPMSIWTSGKWIRRGQAGCRCDWAGAPSGYAPKCHGQRAVGTGVAGCNGRPPASHQSDSAALPRSFGRVTDQAGSRTGAVRPTVPGTLPKPWDSDRKPEFN